VHTHIHYIFIYSFLRIFISFPKPFAHLFAMNTNLNFK
jgi:hypothetical protein